MLKKIVALSLVCACNLSFAAAQKATVQKVLHNKARMVTLSDREVAAITKAHEVASTRGDKAALVAKYAKLAAQGKREIERDERNKLMDQVYEQLGRESGQLA